MNPEPSPRTPSLIRGTPHPKNPNLLFWSYKSTGEHWVLRGEFNTLLARLEKKPARPAVGGDLKRGTPHPKNPNLLFWGYRRHCPNGEYWVLKPQFDSWIRKEKRRYHINRNKRLVQRSTPEARAANAAAVRRYRERKKAAQIAS